jgi:hypothetical protein
MWNGEWGMFEKKANPITFDIRHSPFDIRVFQCA